MRKIFIILLTLILILTGCTSQIEVTGEAVEKEGVDYEVFFDETIHELRIEISEEDWTDILDNPLEESYHSADISLDGVSVDNIGFRTKGNSTLRSVANSASERYSFKFKINEYEDQKLLGLDEFVVNNMFSDASYLREYISYKAMAANGAIVPATSFVNVYINGELYGFYLLVESVDDSFLNRQFGNNDGNLYRADQGTTLAIEDGKYIENAEQKNGEDQTKADLYRLMDVLDEMVSGDKGDLEAILDVDSALNMIAANTLLQNYDSLNGQFSQNYYLYNDGGIFKVIPWDYNMAFGTFAGDTDLDIDSPVIGTSMENAVLIQKLLSVEEYKERYYEILEGYLTYFSDFEVMVTDLAAMVEPFVKADPSKFSTLENFYNNTVYQEDGLSEIPGGPGNKGLGGNRDMPEGMTPPDGGTDGKFPEGEPPTDGQGKLPPQGMETDGQPPMDMVDKRPVDKQGDDQMMAGNDVSIINILMARMASIEDQLSQK